MAAEEFARPDDYPTYVTTPEQRRRWDLAKEAAAQVAEAIGGDDTTAWLATRSIYSSDLPTDDPDSDIPSES